MTPEHAVTILVVDDNPASLYATSRVLRAAGFTVIEAATGQEALDAAEQAHLVILDVNLPDIDGIAVCSELRRRETSRRTPVIHLSATFVGDTHKVRGLEAGADGYLTHPVEPPVLIATVNAFLRARRAEDAMRASEAKFRAIFDHAINGITLLSREMILLEANPSMCRAIGFPREHIIGKHLNVFTRSRDEPTLAEIAGQLENGAVWRGTFPLLRADGTAVELEWNVSTHSDPGVRLAIVNDVTERKRIEMERERLLDSERTARSEAERANRLKDDFLATLSHELRTPLNAIVGWSQILRKEQPQAEDYAEGLEVIERNARAQAQLIADLLDVSRISSGKLRLDLQTFELSSVIRESLQGVGPAAAAKGVRLEIAVEPNTGAVLADPARLQQVMWNLLNNAVKFTPHGGAVRVSAHRAKSTVQIVVADTGKGIAPDFLPFIFERFRQQDSSSRRDHGGLGLGLAIVKSIVELHGGTVAAASGGLGKGSQFTIVLPIAAVQPAVDTPDAAGEVSHEASALKIPSEAASAAPVGDLSLEGVRVLVVDDDADARVLLRRLLRDAGAQMMDAPDAATAVAIVESFHPDVLVSDIGMAQTDGYDLLRSLRKRGYGVDRLPAIALTAFARPEDRQRALEVGFQLHLGKPVEPRQLLASIASLAPTSGNCAGRW